MKVSVVIPSYKDPLLQPTIDSLLSMSELGDQLEVVAVMDGYKQELKPDPRLVVVHLGKNRGMRGAINAGVSVARGEYLMRTDEHCMFCKGYDKILVESCQPNWIMTGKRYFLDPIKWKIMDIPPVECEKLIIQGGIKFAGLRWDQRAKEISDPILESMAMQGSMWFMPHKWWDEVIGELDTENYGPLYQDSHEMVFKTWKKGGKLMFNRNMWFAHKHRSFSRTHNNGTPENPSKNNECWAYSLKIWKDYYENEIRKKWNI